MIGKLAVLICDALRCSFQPLPVARLLSSLAADDWQRATFPTTTTPAMEQRQCVPEARANNCQTLSSSLTVLLLAGAAHGRELPRTRGADPLGKARVSTAAGLPGLHPDCEHRPDSHQQCHSTTTARAHSCRANCLPSSLVIGESSRVQCVVSHVAPRRARVCLPHSTNSQQP